MKSREDKNTNASNRFRQTKHLQVKKTVFNCKEKAKDLKTHLRSWFICPLQMVFSGTVLKVLGLANSTIFSATNKPKPNFLLT